MSVTIHDFTQGTLVPLLHTLSSLLARGAEKLDPATMVGLRLAPDMHPLTRQVQFVCFQAVDAAARLTGRLPPEVDTPEETLAQLQRRIAAAIATLRELSAEALVGAEDRPVRRQIGEQFDLEMTGLQYLRDFTLPNFYFHLVTTYAILRNHGVDLGKADYMAHIAYALRPRAAATV
ncbi:DUF1993 domain-containing protein [Nannocystis punicea]|uniref:DUF1993 domain-containing protein n=1 Tax=Nannocystis punicea TaxID=2995304 RepID=A0ABY7GVU9_9BACT|nr:DUF1993 domain-containing protein [Nannocystis poenicansa]WAS91077.1 DUF1993 domain-containing protein [Nannocystis poenicansa]